MGKIPKRRNWLQAFRGEEDRKIGEGGGKGGQDPWGRGKVDREAQERWREDAWNPGRQERPSEGPGKPARCLEPRPVARGSVQPWDSMRTSDSCGVSVAGGASSWTEGRRAEHTVDPCGARNAISSPLFFTCTSSGVLRHASKAPSAIPPPSIDPSIWTVRFHPDPSPGTSPPSIPGRRRPRPSHRYLSHSNRYLGPCPCDRLRISGVGGMRHEMAPFERRQRRSPCRWRLPAAPLRTCARLGGDRARIVSPGRRPDGFEASQEARTDPRNRSTSPTWWQLPTAGNCARHRRETP